MDFKKHLKKLTLLHSNDLHGDFLAEKVDDNLVGGVSMLSGYINQVRAEESNVIYAIAGDMFRGSVIDSEYKGISTIEIMNALAPDIVTIGNHEIDYGIAHLLFIEKCAQFPIINANLFIKTNHARLFPPYHIMEIDGMKILFIGIITNEILAQAKQDDLIGSFIGVEEAANEIGRICNTYNRIDIDFTVLLTHIGFEADKELAALLQPEWGVDVIIGGHSHTLMEQPVEVNGILIAQAGVGTDQIGRFDIVVNTDTNSVESYTWNCIPINAQNCPVDEQLDNLIRKYKTITDQKYARVVTRFSRPLTHPRRNTETALGNLFADIFKESLGIDVMLLGSGSIRNDLLGPIVEYGKLIETFPYDDGIYMLKVSGQDLRQMLTYMLRDDAFLGKTEFYQLSKGLQLVYSYRHKKILSLTFNGKEVKDQDIFSIGMQKFHFNNIESFLNLTEDKISALAKPTIVSTSCLDILEEYLSSHKTLNRDVEGRITIIDYK
ncbi:bifunctional metallophosphatase/5'-nucleotidase [Clostridiales bacterium COT073_COT-073]|nr:bifunctional metallophosphatase/5'-nucleotidase [Clostridiales bacterium COT073_COT-073]